MEGCWDGDEASRMHRDFRRLISYRSYLHVISISKYNFGSTGTPALKRSSKSRYHFGAAELLQVFHAPDLWVLRRSIQLLKGYL
jgi:hypothetical protein